MSMYLPFGKFEQSTEMLQAPGASFPAEGQIAVRNASNTSAGVMPSTGTGTGTGADIFCGFVIAGTSALPFAEPTYSKVETFLVPATGVVTLSVTPDSGADVGALDLTTGQFYTTTSTPAITVTGAQVSGLTAGDQVQVTYKYDLTVVQRRALFGDIQPGGYVGDTIGQIGVVTRGTVFTTEFDHSANWALAGSTAALQLVAGANGQVKLGTVGTNGVAIPGYVVALPTQDIPFLGITFVAP
jgi:hypothetical protein